MNWVLYDVMRDAIKKMEGEDVPELLFFLISKMLEYNKICQKEGLLALEDACKKDCNIPEFERIFVMPIGPQLISSGCNEEYVTEVLIAKYWANNPQGIYAMANFIVIRSLLASICKNDMINLNRYMLQDLLISYLPEGSKEKYETYKLHHFPESVIPEKTPKEELMETKPHEFDTDYIINARDRLEKEIMDTEVSILKQVIEADDGWHIPLVLRYIHNKVREKLFSCITEEKAQQLSDEAIYGPPVLLSDVMNSLTYFLIEIIEYKTNDIQN